MLATELIAMLQIIVDEHPDAEVCIYLENIIDDDDFGVSEIEGAISLIPELLDPDRGEE
jgi:hypothetical protein